MVAPEGSLQYTILRETDGQWGCSVHRFELDNGGWKLLVFATHKTVTGAFHTSQQMAIDLLSAPTAAAEEG